jgi:guanine deaminase
MTAARAFLGTLLDATAPEAVRVREGALLCVGEGGVITEVIAADAPGHARAVANAEADGALHRLGPREYLLPGLVDLHVHAPQWPQAGKALDQPLERWLLSHTFPLEARFAEPGFARRVHAHLVRSLLANGTTSAVYYASQDLGASVGLAEECVTQGQRAWVGRVAMDHPEMTEGYYRDASAEAGVADTRAHALAVRALPGNDAALVRPIVTPRFIPACTDALLDGLGELAEELDLAAQTHCSEGDWEHGFVLQRMGVSDATALDRFGLLRRCVLAHGVFLSRDDLALVAARSASIAHCPLSNFLFAGAALPVRECLSAGVAVGLGTDIAGGAKSGLLDAARHAIVASAALADGVNPALAIHARGARANARFDWRTAFWLATAGGAAALGAPVGRFEPGLEFDAILVEANRDDADLTVWDGLDGAEDAAQKILWTAERPNIRRVWVRGREVVRKD